MLIKPDWSQIDHVRLIVYWSGSTTIDRYSHIWSYLVRPCSPPPSSPQMLLHIDCTYGFLIKINFLCKKVEELVYNRHFLLVRSECLKTDMIIWYHSYVTRHEHTSYIVTCYSHLVRYDVVWGDMTRCDSAGVKCNHMRLNATVYAFMHGRVLFYVSLSLHIWSYMSRYVHIFLHVRLWRYDSIRTRGHRVCLYMNLSLNISGMGRYLTVHELIYDHIWCNLYLIQTWMYQTTRSAT